MEYSSKILNHTNLAKEHLISGSIFEFILPSKEGFGYCKLLDFTHIRKFDGLIVKVFDYTDKQPIKDISVLNEKDWLFGARRMPWLPNVRGKNAWKHRGFLISKNDDVIPDFKYCIKSSHLIDDDSKIGPWDVVKNINQYIPSTFEQVKHLEDTVVSGT